MKVFIPLLVLSNLVVAPAAVVRDAKEALRDHLMFCTQFVIHDPDPRIVPNQMRDCCAFNRNIPDCQMYNWGVIERWAARGRALAIEPEPTARPGPVWEMRCDARLC
jgi:hypothetical protein